MPTTSLTNSTFAVSAIGGRTDSSGTAVADYTAEEARFLAASILTEGYLTTNAFKVAQSGTPGMSVVVGSGTAKADYYAVDGDVAGQGRYLVRLDTTSQSVTVPAADASQTRTDEVYLVVQDSVYDASSRALPVIGYRKGDLGGANPGPDAGWKASVLLARITVAAGATSIVTANISDQRAAASLAAPKVSLNGSDLQGLLNGKSDTSHGHDLLATNMASTYVGWTLYGSDYTQTIPTGTNTRLSLNRVDYNAGSFVGVSSDVPGDKFTLTATGIWSISHTCRFDAGFGAGERYAEITVNGTTITGSGGYANGNPHTINLHWTGHLQSGDVVRVQVYQSTGGDVTMTNQQIWRNIGFALIRRTG